MSRMDFLRRMDEIDDGVLERFETLCARDLSVSAPAPAPVPDPAPVSSVSVLRLSFPSRKRWIAAAACFVLMLGSALFLGMRLISPGSGNLNAVPVMSADGVPFREGNADGQTDGTDGVEMIMIMPPGEYLKWAAGRNKNASETEERGEVSVSDGDPGTKYGENMGKNTAHTPDFVIDGIPYDEVGLDASVCDTDALIAGADQIFAGVVTQRRFVLLDFRTGAEYTGEAGQQPVLYTVYSVIVTTGYRNIKAGTEVSVRVYGGIPGEDGEEQYRLVRQAGMDAVPVRKGAQILSRNTKYLFFTCDDAGGRYAVDPVHFALPIGSKEAKEALTRMGTGLNSWVFDSSNK